MRIRRQASKLLGWAYNFSAPVPTLSASSSTIPPAASYCWPPPLLPDAGAGELQCQLNLSPWDAMECHHCTNSQEELLELPYGEEAIGVIGNGFEEKDESIMDAIVSKEREDDVQVEVKDIVESKEENGRTSKNSEKQMAVAFMKCKKTDGKGWHCKRNAQLPHSLCSYHLAQLRSYRARYDEEAFEDGIGHGHRRRKKSAAASAGRAGASYYYYYSVLGPWWSKRRGPVDGSRVGGEYLMKESLESHETVGVPSVDDDGDEGSNIKMDQEVHACCCVDDRCAEGEDGSRCEVMKRKKRPLKKRGRKPVKARSLKSLL